MTTMHKATVRLSTALLVAAAGLVVGPATSSWAEPESPTESPAETPTESPKAGGHQVTYTITATSDLTGNISYIRTDPPSMAAYNANSEIGRASCRERTQPYGGEVVTLSNNMNT